MCFFLSGLFLSGTRVLITTRGWCKCTGLSCTVFVTDLCVYIEVALAFVTIISIYESNECQICLSMTKSGTYEELQVLWLIEWDSSDSLLLWTLLVIWMHSWRFNHAQYFCWKRGGGNKTYLCFCLGLKKFLQIFVVCFCVHPWLINEYAVMVFSCCH